MKNTLAKGQHPIVATPVKHEKHDLQEERGRNSSSNGKGDAAFQLYCQQNLSPINSFGFGKSSFLLSPNPPASKNFPKTKSVFSPGLGPGQFSKFNPNPHHISIQNGNQTSLVVSNIDYQVPQKDDFESEFPHHSMKGLATPLYFNKFPTTPLSTKFYSHPNGGASLKNQNPVSYPEPHARCYVYSSPVFKISFSCKEQLDKFLESDMRDREQIQEITLESCSGKAILSKAQENDFENLQNSYKRVIQFNDENEEEEHEQPKVQEKKDDSQEDEEQIEEEVEEGQRQSNKHRVHGVIQRNLIGGEDKRNLFEVAPPKLTSYDSQMTFNPNNNYAENTTTVKKLIDVQQQQSQDSIKTAQKWNQSQKKKLFDSPQFENDKDLHTPSTKKKKAPLSNGQTANTNSSSTRAVSHKQKSSEKHQKNKKIDLKQDQNEHEQEEEDQMNIKKELSQFTISQIKPICEDRKICCNCKRTKCLKLYCECFAASRVCEGCTCQGCYNKTEFESMRQEARNAILERDSSAFDPKIEQQAVIQLMNKEEGEQVDPELKAHSKGCNCKKSNCLKKYCECFQLGVKCSKLCKCDHCKNIPGPHPPSYEDGDSRMSSGALKGNSRKSKMIASQTGGEYSQYNQFNYFHSEQCYPYYYPQYYGAYPFYGDFCMLQKQEEGNEQKQQETIVQKEINPQSKSHKKQKSHTSNHKRKNIEVKQAEEVTNVQFPTPQVNKKRKVIEDIKINVKKEEKKEPENVPNIVEEEIIPKAIEKCEEVIEAEENEKVPISVSVVNDKQEEIKGKDEQEKEQIEEEGNINSNFLESDQKNDKPQQVLDQEEEASLEKENKLIEKKDSKGKSQQESSKKSKSKKTNILPNIPSPPKTRKQINESSKQSQQEATNEIKSPNNLSVSKTTTRNQSAQKQPEGKNSTQRSKRSKSGCY